MIRTYRIAEVGIRVADLEKMSAFYQKVLGFELHKTEPDVVFLTVGPLDSDLGAVGHPQLFALFGRGHKTDVALSTFDHIAFEIDTAQYEQELARFQSMDMVIRERAWPDTLLWRGRSFFIRDPEGNVVELIAAT